MAEYSDARIDYADWNSIGRSFAWVCAGSVLVGVTALFAGFGYLPSLIDTSADLAFAAIVGWIGLGLGIVAGVVALGSIAVTHLSKYSLVVSGEGVRLDTPRKSIAFGRAEITGVAAVREGTVVLTASAKKWLLIPKTLSHRVECLQEIKDLGIPVLPPLRQTRMQVVARWVALVPSGCSAHAIDDSFSRSPLIDTPKPSRRIDNRMPLAGRTGCLACLPVAVDPGFSPHRIESSVSSPPSQSANDQILAFAPPLFSRFHR